MTNGQEIERVESGSESAVQPFDARASKGCRCGAGGREQIGCVHVVEMAFGKSCSGLRQKVPARNLTDNVV